MARARVLLCSSCGAGGIAPDRSFCGRCGHPTPWASHEERIAWEVREWRRARGVAGPAATPRSSRDRPAVEPVEEAARLARKERRPSGRARRALRRVGERLGALLRWLLAASAPIRLDDLAPSDALRARPRLRVVAAGPGRPDRRASRGAGGSTRDPSGSRQAAGSTPARGSTRAAGSTAGSTPAVRPRSRAATTDRAKRPTNEDMLERTLVVLERVDRRLERMEREVTARRRPTAAPDAGPAAPCY
jgi:hypothetical protein